MMADADTAEVETSPIPHPLVLCIAIFNLAAGASVLMLGVLFKALEALFLKLLPAVALVWGVMMVISPEAAAKLLNSDVAQWQTEGDEEEAPASVPAGPASSPLLPALVATASWGAISAGHSGCVVTKAKFLPFVSLMAYAVFGSPLSSPAAAFFVLSPLAVASGNFAYPLAMHRMRKSQRDAVAFAREVGVGDRGLRENI